MKNKRKRLLAAIPAILIVLFGTSIATRKTPPNIVIIVMDTARQDRLSAYGYDRATSPNLVGLARSSRIYHNAYSTSGWTVPAHASLFTGLFTVAHKSTQEAWDLDSHLTTLAEVLSENGYETVGITGNANLRKESGFDQGFSEYYETWREPYKSAGGAEGGTQEHPALSILDSTLAQRGKDRPLFLFMNLIEPHSPYNSSRQFHDRFITDPGVTLERNMWRLHFLEERVLSEDELRHLNELYDAEILYTDYLVGRVIERLREADLWNDTVFIVTSDHGENIGEHGMMDHVFSLYETTTKIPLIIRYPRLFRPGSKDYSIVQLTDIFPTLLGIIGIDAGGYPSQGRDLLAEESEDTRAVFTEYYYPRQALNAFKSRQDSFMLERYRRRIRSITFNDVKLIWGSDGRNELYDLASDPAEARNLTSNPAYASLQKELQSRLEGLVDRYAAASDTLSDSREKMEDEPVDEETRRELKSLGYVQ